MFPLAPQCYAVFVVVVVVVEVTSQHSHTGDRVCGGGCCGDLPVFFSQNSGLVAVVARQAASLLPDALEESLCSSLAAAPPEVSRFYSEGFR